MIKKISLRNFRNHPVFEMKFDKPFVYFHGPNGSGKTSILESIYFCATTKSPRTSEETDLILKNEAFTQVKVTTDQNQYEITMTKKGKRATINGVEKRKLSDYIGHLRVVFFSPEDLELIKGSPVTRRQFIDMEWMQLNKQYLRLLNTYKHVLKQRNILLKKINIDDDYTFLDILGDQLYDAGVEIINERQKMIDLLNQNLKEIYALFSTHQIDIIYEPNADDKAFKKHLKKQQKTDIINQTTSVGPHRDDFYIQFNGFDAKTYASQGEQRLIVVALKLGLLKLIKDLSKQPVTLLLDDILSELDSEKQQIFLLQLPKEHQIIMNSTQEIKGDHIQMIHLT